MKSILATGLAVVALAGMSWTQDNQTKPKVGAKVGNLIPEFTAPVSDLALVDAKEAKLSSRKGKGARAYLFMSTTCPYVKAYRGRIAELATKYSKKGIEFVYVYPNRAEADKAKMAYHRSGKFAGWWLNDAKAAIAKSLQVDRTPTVVVTDAKGIIIFRGGIDDNPFNAKKVKRPHLANAFDDVLADRPVKVKTARTYG